MFILPSNIDNLKMSKNPSVDIFLKLLRELQKEISRKTSDDAGDLLIREVHKNYIDFTASCDGNARPNVLKLRSIRDASVFNAKGLLLSTKQKA